LWINFRDFLEGVRLGLRSSQCDFGDDVEPAVGETVESALAAEPVGQGGQLPAHFFAQWASLPLFALQICALPLFSLQIDFSSILY